MKVQFLLTVGAVLHQASAFYYSLEASRKPSDTSYTLDIYTDKNQKACTYGLDYLTMNKEFAFSDLHSDISDVVYPECKLLVVDWQPTSITVEGRTYSCVLANSVANEYATYQCRGPSDTMFQTTSTVTTTTTRTTSTSRITGTPTATCIGKSKGKKKGDGYKGYCCSSSADCKESCIKGVCNGPVLKTTTKTSTKTSIAPNSCIAGGKNKKKGNGKKGYCCSSSDDCKKSCVKGKCN